jgi:hypothetical protein
MRYVYPIESKHLAVWILYNVVFDVYSLVSYCVVQRNGMHNFQQDGIIAWKKQNAVSWITVLLQSQEPKVLILSSKGTPGNWNLDHGL